MKTILYYVITEEGNFRAMRKVNEYEAYEPVTIRGKKFERKTLEGLKKLLAKYEVKSFELKEIA